MRWFGLPLLLIGFVLAAPSAAHAASITFQSSGPGEKVQGKDVNLSASALFEINGSTLKITLRNTGDSSGTGMDVPGNQLTGVFFDLPSGVTLTPVSATVAPGAILQANQCDPGKCNGSTTNVGGEFAYNTGTFGTHPGNHGISSSGYINTPAGNFNGPDLDAPAAPNGPNFGIVSTANPFNPNGGLANVPLIKDEVVFTLTIKKDGSTYTGLDVGDISNVSFQYGTSFSQPKLPPGITPPKRVPEPAALLLVVPAFAAVVRRRIGRVIHR